MLVCVCRSLPAMRRKLKASTPRECGAGCFSFHCGPDRAAQVVVAHSNAKTKVPLCVCVSDPGTDAGGSRAFLLSRCVVVVSRSRALFPTPVLVWVVLCWGPPAHNLCSFASCSCPLGIGHYICASCFETQTSVCVPQPSQQMMMMGENSVRWVFLLPRGHHWQPPTM